MTSKERADAIIVQIMGMTAGQLPPPEEGICAWVEKQLAAEWNQGYDDGWQDGQKGQRPPKDEVHNHRDDFVCASGPQEFRAKP